MKQFLGSIALVVTDYDEAIAWYVDKLGFVLLEDERQGEDKRWVRVAPPGASECALLLAKASNERQQAVVGTQTGGRVGFFLHTDDFWRDYRHMAAAGVSFSEQPREEAYGTVVVFEDLYGNRWDLLQLESGV